MCSGIGLNLAIECAKEGAKEVVIVARDANRLAEAKKLISKVTLGKYLADTIFFSIVHECFPTVVTWVKRAMSLLFSNKWNRTAFPILTLYLLIKDLLHPYVFLGICIHLLGLFCWARRCPLWASNEGKLFGFSLCCQASHSINDSKWRQECCQTYHLCW